MASESRNVSQAKALRVGVIGAGKMGIQHLRAIAGIPGARIVGIADPRADLGSVKELLPSDARLVDDAHELLEELRPDVVHIVTPPQTHATLARLAIQYGCHVYIEKPFAPSRAEAEEILALAASRGVAVCAGHQCLFERPAILAREALSSIGRLVQIESYFSFQMVRRNIAPAEQVKDILPHAVYPLVEQLRLGSRMEHAQFSLKGLDVSASGDVYALVRLGECTGVLLVSLSGRPIEQYQHIIGTNGSLRADYVTGSVTRLLGPGTGPGVLFTPYRRALQTITGATRGFSKLIFGRVKSYPGLSTLVAHFYHSIANREPAPITPQSIVDTVYLCEQIGHALDSAEREAERAARARVTNLESELPPTGVQGAVLLTGGTGLLGKRVAEELRHAGFSVRVLTRRMPRMAVRIPGVDYLVGDLGDRLDPTLLKGVRLVVHCAAETAGDKDAHQRNSVDGTRHIIEAAASAGVRDFIHISSLAVLKPGYQVGGGPLDEQSPVDGNLDRGPYVWGKAESEQVALRLARELDLRMKVLRPGPLVDYAAFQPPGRLGRELGPWFVAIGGRRAPLSVCDVGTAARVIRSYAQDFDAAPPLVNLVEAPPPTRGDLADRVRGLRPDLKFIWVPALILRVMSGPLKLAQRLLLGSAKPIDVYVAFSSERYRTELAASVINQAKASSICKDREHVGQQV